MGFILHVTDFQMSSSELAKIGYQNNNPNNVHSIIVAIILTHWGRDEMNNISQTTFSNAFSSMEMFEFRLKFHWSLFPRVQFII